MSGRNARKSHLRSFVGRTALGAALAAAGVLFASESLQNAAANGDTRALTLHHTHTGEDITVTFKRDGRYDDDGLKKLNWFLRDWRRDESTRMDPKLFDIVWEVYREASGKQPVTIISAYRSPKTNAMLRRRGRGVAQYSQHMVGKAMDFYIPGIALEEIRAAGLRLQRGGVGFYPTSGSPFVHLDTGSVRHWPRMTHDQLARVFPNGRTVHLPSDGRRLSGYALAMADVERRGGSAARGGSESQSDASDAGPQFAEKSKRFFAKLFGFRGDEDEDAAEVTASAPARGATPARAAAAPARVPLPPTRPVAVQKTAATPSAQPQSGGFALAAASSTPVEVKQTPQRTGDISLASASAAPVELIKQSSADVINARGLWRGGANDAGQGAPAATPGSAQPRSGSGAIGANGAPRFVWITGPQGQPIEPRPPESVPNPAKPGAIAVNDTTASVAPWPVADGKNQRDRVPADVALAYAAEAAPQPTPPRAAPMGTLRPAWQQTRPQPPAAASPSPPAVPAPVPAKAGQRYNDPWLRGVVIAPSVHYSMSVAVFGAVDYRNLRQYMHKPAAVVAMMFSPDPNLGMTTLNFGGPAVNFVPTISFAQKTAHLN